MSDFQKVMLFLGRRVTRALRERRPPHEVMILTDIYRRAAFPFGGYKDHLDSCDGMVCTGCGGIHRIIGRWYER